jgi:FMN-dependent NADH-azoreductase
MSKLLRIDVSPRGQDWSVSKRLGDVFVSQWLKQNPGGEVCLRDISAGLPMVDLSWIAGSFNSPDQRTDEQKAALKISDELIAEILSSTEILIATPMWNFSLPTMLKSWIDLVVRIGLTFSATYEGLAAGRKVWVIRASGSGYGPDSPMAAMNQFDLPLRTILGFIGLKDVTIYGAEHTNHVEHGRFSLDAYTTEHAPNSDVAAEVAKARVSMDAYIDKHVQQVEALITGSTPSGQMGPATITAGR